MRNRCTRARKDWQKAKKKNLKNLKNMYIHIDIEENIIQKERIYRESKKDLKIEINRAKNKAWSELIRDIEEDPWGLPYKLVLNKLRRSSPGVTEQLDKETLDKTIAKLFPCDEEWFIDRDTEWEDWNDRNLITVQEIHDIVKKRKSVNNKAPGIDGIKSLYIKKAPESFTDRITQCLNVCLKKGIFPKIWKKALLILIPKGPLDLKSPKVRPICLLNEMGKVLERVIAKRIDEWMQENAESRLVRNQFGFCRKKSTCNAILYVQEFIDNAMQNKEIAIGVSLDISNAFNTIKWQYIRAALREMKFPDYIRRIMDDYLSDRTIEFPTCNGETVTRNITMGVPQGSVLGPTLWNLAYNWVLKTPREPGCDICGYADDTIVLARAEDTSTAVCKINMQLSRVLRRIKRLELTVAESKTEAVIFYRKEKPRLDIPIRVGHTEVYAQEHMKYFGLLIDSKWSFKAHIEYIEQKVSKVTRALGRVMPNLRGPRENKRRLYANTIMSVIVYGAPIWSEAINESYRLQSKIKQIQRPMAIRVISGYRTTSADAALLLARIPPAMLYASYMRRVFLRVQELKDNDTWNKSAEKEIKREEEILMRRQWEL